MTFLVFLVIALAWVGALLIWTRDRVFSQNARGPAFPSLQRRAASGTLMSPRSVSSARRRRREVLGSLLLLAVTTLFIARAWPLFWTLQLLVDLALVVYGWAVLSIERPQSTPSRPSLMPVMVSANDSRPSGPRPGPRPDPAPLS